MQRNLTDISNWDQEDILMAVLEARECFRCGNKLKLVEIGGIRQFLVEHGMLSASDVPQILWEQPHDSELGVLNYECESCGAKWEVYSLQGNDWEAVMHEGSSDRSKDT